MEGDLLESITDSSSTDVPPLDLIFNHHSMNKVFFRENFHPLTNDYMIGFWLATFLGSMWANPEQITDVLFGTLGDNNGFKTLTILPGKADNGKNRALIRNFFFNSDSRKIKHGGLSTKEREQINFLLDENFEPKIVEYLIYDISHSCINKSFEMRYQPYMELQMNIAPGDDDAPGQVKKFIRLGDFVDFPPYILQEASFLKNKGHTGNIEKLITLINVGWRNNTMKQLTADLQKPFKFGFTHGFILSTQPIHKHDVKVLALGEMKHTVNLIMQKQTRLEDVLNFSPPVSYYLEGMGKKVDFQEKFKEMIIETISEPCKVRNVSDILKEYTENLIRSLVTLDTVYKDDNYLRTYLRGMFMTCSSCTSFHLDTKRPYYDVYSTKNYMQIALLVSSRCLILFNFENETAIEPVGLEAAFLNATSDGCVYIISISETEPGCLRNLSDKNLMYNLNVTLFNSKASSVAHNSASYKNMLQTNFVRKLLLKPDFSNKDALDDIFDTFTHMVSGVVDVLKRDPDSFIYILEGLFHDKSSYFGSKKQDHPRMEQLHSRSIYSIRIEMGKKITQINFLNIDRVGEYIDSDQHYNKKNQYEIISFFYGYDRNTGNLRLHMKVGLDFGAEIFTRSLCYDSKVSKVQCPETKQSARRKRGVSSVFTGFLAKFFNRLRENSMSNSNIKRTNTLAFPSIILDDLSTPFYTLGDIIWTKILFHDTLAFLEDIKLLKVTWKMKSILARSGAFVPIIGVVLGAMDTMNAWESYKNGDTNAFAIYNIFAGGVFFTTSLISLTIGILKLAGVTAAVMPVVGWIVFAVGTIFYIAGHIWKGLDDPEAFKQVFRSLWEDTKSFFNDPKEFLRNKDADPALNLAIEIMENNKMIRNVIMTPTCGEDTCTEIGIDLIHKKELPKVDYKLVRPSMPTKYNNKYKQLCSVFKITAGWWEKFSQGVVTWTSFLALANSGNDYPCINSVGVGRITNEGTADALSVYLLHGNSMVQAIQNTNSIFKLSKGKHCQIYGGQKENTFIFASSFEKCSIVSPEHSINFLDLSEIQNLHVVQIVNSTILAANSEDNTTRSSFSLQNIRTIITQQHSEYGEFLIVCSNISLVIKEREEGKLDGTGYKIKIQDDHGCAYDLAITSHGGVVITSQAKSGKTAYTFPSVTGDVYMYLADAKSAMTHSIMWKSISITNITNLDLNALVIDTDIISFQFNGYRIYMELRENTYQLMFADGLELKCINKTLFIDIFFPKSKGQLWYTYGVLFNNLESSTSNIKLNAYSERDDEIFTLTGNGILINNTTMPFSFFASNDELNGKQKIVCKSGYNVILVMVSCCESIQNILRKRAMWFDPFTVEVTESLDVLVIDFTYLIDLVNHSIEAYAMDIELTQNLDIHEVTLDVFASSWENGSMDKHLIGTITFKSDLIDNMLYKKVKITAKHNFILTRDESTGHLRVVPLPITVCPFSPAVMLDRHSVYKNQVILFDDRSLPNYDLVKLDNTTLLITDVLSNAGKGLIFSQLSIPLLVVMVKNYKDDRMRTLTLKFEQEMQLSMDKVDENGMMEFDEFDKRFSSLTERLAREEFILEYDTRIGINYEKIPEEISMMTNKLEVRRRLQKRKNLQLKRKPQEQANQEA